MGDVDGIAESVLPHRNTRDIAIGNGVDMLALDTLGANVKAAVKVVRTGFAEIPRQRDVVVYWRGKNT